MGFDENVEMVRLAFYQVLISSGPFLGAALAIGLIIGIIQAATSIQEMTLSFVPKIETLKGVLNLEKIFQTKLINHIMLDTEDLYTDVENDVQLYTYLIDRVKNSCYKYNIQLLELYGVVFKELP